MERITKLTPAYDKRHKDPKKNYGIHGVDVRMILKGDLGAVQFVLFTNWYLKHIDKSRWSDYMKEPLPADLGYHSPKPKYEGHTRITESCEYLDGKPCYYDGCGVAAGVIYDILLKEGSDGVWEELEDIMKQYSVN